MKTVFILKGLPASGKSTWAKEMVAAHPGQYKRVNKDDLRAMLDASHWSKGNEKFVLNVRDHVIYEALLDGKHVIVDDTNFAEVHEKRIREILLDPVLGEVKVEVKFFDTPLDECLKRDALRGEKAVGEKVIREMYDRYLRPEAAKAPAYDPALPDAVIVDLDGTAAIMGDRGPFDWDKVGIDTRNEVVHSIVSRLPDRTRILFVSGRDEVCRRETQEWLAKHYQNIHEGLFMRPAGDQRKDAIVKQELYEANIKGRYNVRFVLDDRDQVVKMWRGLGITCLQVADGNF